MKRHYTDEELIEGLRQRNRNCIEYLYREYTPVIRHFLLHNSGNQQDAEDLFQDGMIALYKRSTVEPLLLQCTLKTYFMSVCKNLWLQRLETKHRLLYQADCEVHESREPYSMEDQDIHAESLELQRLFFKNMMLLPDECRQLLQLYCLKIPYREIARLLNFKDEAYVKTRKYFCKKLLRRKILNDPESHQFLNYERTRIYH